MKEKTRVRETRRLKGPERPFKDAHDGESTVEKEGKGEVNAPGEGETKGYWR